MALPYFKSAFAAAALLMSGATLSAHAGPFDELEVAESAQTFASYEYVYVAPVVMDLTFDPNYRLNSRRSRSSQGYSRPMSEREIARKAEDLHEDLTHELGKKMTVVDAPGEGVLTVETTVSQILSSRPTYEELATRVGLSFSGSVSAGGANIHITLSENGETQATLRENYRGNLNDGFPRVNIWQDADRAYTRLSRKLGRFVSRN